MKQYVAILASVLILASCTAPTPTPVAVAPTQAPTQTPLPTNTPAPTSTVTPTLTPVPPTATATATASPSATPTWTATPTSTPTTRPTVVPVVPLASPTAPLPAGMIYAALKLVRPVNGAHIKGWSGSEIVFEWIPVVGTLENGKTRCTWKDQPSGQEASLYDRYFIEFDPPLDKINPWLPKINLVEAGPTGHTFNLGVFKPATTYTWRAAIGRWCVTPTNAKGFLGLVSPYSESRTFDWSP